MTQAVLDLAALRVSFRARSTDVTALRDVSFQLQPGNTLALVGKSGSGKTTLGRTLLRLVEPSAGKTRYDGVDLNSLTPEQMRAMRQRMQITFQDPMSSLNPRLRVADIIAEGLVAHSIGTKPERCDRVAALLEEEVGLRADHMSRFAQEFSSGQRQRIGIARALALEPKFIVADESVSALDVSFQAQVLRLLLELRAKRSLTKLFIAHDLSEVKYLCDQIVVMYLGKLVEIGPARPLYKAPPHPYTEALLSAIPLPNPGLVRHRTILRGNIPSPLAPPLGCVFRTRCPDAAEICAAGVPAPMTVAPGHQSYCKRLKELHEPVRSPRHR
jgi:peptide/nickel transport system ATP-binding protein